MGRRLTVAGFLAVAAALAAATDVPSLAQAAARVPTPQPDALPPPASPGALLVIGGVLMMGGVLAVSAARATLPSAAAHEPPRQPPRVHTSLRLHAPRGASAYRGPREEEFARGYEVGRRLPVFTLEGLFDAMVETEVGEPRVLRSMPNFMRVRLHACRGCSGAGVARDGCAFERGFLEAGLGRVLGREALVHEVACQARGAPACEFEVWH